MQRFTQPGVALLVAAWSSVLSDVTIEDEALTVLWKAGSAALSSTPSPDRASRRPGGSLERGARPEVLRRIGSAGPRRSADKDSFTQAGTKGCSGGYTAVQHRLKCRAVVHQTVAMSRACS
jgi:hypothetical protein